MITRPVVPFMLGLCLVVLVAGASCARKTADIMELDSINPPFGKKLGDMENAYYFVKYKEVECVSYYNYIGPIKRDLVYERVAPFSVYGFFNGQLYTRIMRTWGKSREDFLDWTSRIYQKEPKRTYTVDDWLVYVWEFPDKNYRFKLKHNARTTETKSAKYYLPLIPVVKAAREEAKINGTKMPN